jgi:hypothetical protein
MPPYRGASAKKGVKVVVSTRKPRGNNQHGLIRLQQKDAGGQYMKVLDLRQRAARGAGASASQSLFLTLTNKETPNLERGALVPV